jgi:Bardet-Biedl syndrome 2 protein
MVDMETMRRTYTDLYALNNQLIAGYNNKSTTHEGLLAALKEVNQMIQRAANLRVGSAKTRVISDCRSAVKANNLPTLLRIIKQGYDTLGSSSSTSNNGKK